MKTPLRLIFLMIVSSAVGSLWAIFSPALPGSVSSGFLSPLSMTQERWLMATPTPALPRRLVIPELAVDAGIEVVGQTPEGRMGVPQNVYHAGWYGLGVRPGERGNAVIDGHINTPRLTPSIFAKLETLEPGAIIAVGDASSRWWYFKVVEVREIPTDAFPIEEIFGSFHYPRLNLITCSGTYQRDRRDYSSRIVVFSQLVDVS